MASYRASYSAQEKKLFADKLRRMMLDHGLKGAELARRVSQHLAKPMPRQSISAYLTGTSIPEEATVHALEKVFSIPHGTLLPRPHRLAPGEVDTTTNTVRQDVRIAMVDGGKMRLVLTVEVPQEIGWKIVALLKETGH